MSSYRLESTALFILLAFSLLITLYMPVGSLTGMAPHATDNRFSATHDVNSNEQSFIVKDNVIYKQIWYSIDGSEWQGLNLTGVVFPNNDNWIVGTATYDTLPAAITEPGNHYLITYSCSRADNAWDCHGGKWQLETIIIDAAQEENCTDGEQNQDETGIDCGGSCPNACTTTDIVYAINAGGNAYTASDGTSYDADDYYTGGTQEDRGSIPVSGTEDDYLYSTERWGDCTYSFPVTDGTYEVTLRFMEGYLSAAGERIFDVDVEGMTRTNDLDIYSLVGHDAAYDHTFTAQVTDGTLDIAFSPEIQNPEIGAIVIKRLPTGPTCNDGEQNGEETGRDCGGVCPDACLDIPVGESVITLDFYGLFEAGKAAHFYLRVNGREYESIDAPSTRSIRTYTIPLPRSAISEISIEFDNQHVWDGTDAYRNIYLYDMLVDDEPVDLDACEKENGIWRSGDRITFGLNGEMSCAIPIAGCTPDCNYLMCGESRNACGSCGGCSAGRCLVGHCVTGPPRLEVSGNQLVDPQGNAIVLKGFNYIDQGDLGGGDWDRGDRVELDFAEMERWNVNAVRHLIHPIGNNLYPQDPDLYVEKYLDREISLAAKHGMYSIIDYHDFYMYEAHDRMMAFWTHMAERYAGYDHVIYELFNEPHNGEWDYMLDLYHEAIDIIRSYDPDALIIANGLQWGYDLSYVQDNPVQRPNVAYGTHPYPGKVSYCNSDVSCMRTGWDGKFGDISEQYPVIVTEVGWNDDGSGREWDDSTENFGVPFFDYLNEKEIGYSIMSFTTGYFMDLLLTLEPDYLPTPEAQFIKDDLMSS